MRKWQFITAVFCWGSLSTGIMGAQLLLLPPLEINIDSSSLQPIQENEENQNPNQNQEIDSRMLAAAPAYASPVIQPAELPAPPQPKPVVPFIGLQDEQEPDPAFRQHQTRDASTPAASALPFPAQNKAQNKTPNKPLSTAKSVTTPQTPAPPAFHTNNPLGNGLSTAEIKSPVSLPHVPQTPNAGPKELAPMPQFFSPALKALDSMSVTTDVEVPLTSLPDATALEKAAAQNNTAADTAKPKNQSVEPAINNPFLSDESVPAPSAVSTIPLTSNAFDKPAEAEQTIPAKPKAAADKTSAPSARPQLLPRPTETRVPYIPQNEIQKQESKPDNVVSSDKPLLLTPNAVSPHPSSDIASQQSQELFLDGSSCGQTTSIYEPQLSSFKNPYRSHCLSGSWYVNGYANAGVFCNTHGYRNNSISNCQSDSCGALNGLYISAGKNVCTCAQDYDWGFDVDFMYGYDARYLQTYAGLDQSWVTGHTTRGQRGYGFAMPQLFAELGYKDWRVKAGHFYTLLGYEQSRADKRFFYSQGLAYQALPITHTGVLLSYEGIKNWTGTIGWVNGIDTGFANDNNESLVIGELKYDAGSWLRAKYAFVSGNLSVTELNPFDVLWQDNKLNSHFPQGGKAGVGATHSFVAEIDLTYRWTYVFEFDYNDSKNDIEDTFLPEGESLRNGLCNWRTFSQNLFYTWNDSWKWGVRVEWWKANMTTHRYDNDTNWTGSGKLTSVTLGANWTPGRAKRLVVRPEIRYDHASEPLFAGNTKRDQLYLGGDVMFKY